MPAATIVEVPYWFHVSAVPRRHREPKKFLLRGSFPFEMTSLSEAEAPVRLRARLRVDGHPNMDNDISLRHDGVSYLRAIENLPREPGGERMPFTEDDLRAMLEWRDTAWPDVYGDKDKPAALLTTTTGALSWWEGAHRIHKRPDELQTLAEFSGGIREFKSNDDDKNRRAALAEISSLALVDGALHRRVGAPIAYLSPQGFPHIVHTDQITYEHQMGKPNRHLVSMSDHVMPISFAPWMPALSCHEKAAAMSCEVDAPLETDAKTNLAWAISIAVPHCARWLSSALPEMTADGMAHYRAFRDLLPDATSGDYESGAAAVEQIRAVVEGSPYAGAAESDPEKRFASMRERVAPKLAFLDELARRSGLALEAADEAALSGMTM
jgi:hypothetical protein